MAKFLSNEYLAEATATLNSDAAFQGAIRNVDLSVQFRVTDGPDGTVDYTFSVADGSAALTPGVDDDADVTVSNTYTTAAGISKGEVNTQMAFMQGKLKVGGNMAALMMNQAVITEFANALSTLNPEY